MMDLISEIRINCTLQLLLMFQILNHKNDDKVSEIRIYRHSIIIEFIISDLNFRKSNFLGLSVHSLAVKGAAL